MESASITLYTNPECRACKRVKSKLTEKGVDFDVVDLAEDDEARIALVDMGVRQTPVLKVDDNYLTRLADVLEFVKRVSH